jgi:deoxycytidylate deaminase
MAPTRRSSPIGCVIVMNGNILAARRNKVADHHDATAHAEIEAIRAAGASCDNGELRGATLYTTLRHVHNGLDMVEGTKDRLWSGARGCPQNVLRGAARRHPRFRGEGLSR